MQAEIISLIVALLCLATATKRLLAVLAEMDELIADGEQE